MLKKVLIGIGVLIVLAGAGMFYMISRGRTLSPAGNAEINSGGVNVTVTYSRPSARGRVIFGSEGSDALLPNGKYWRLGANEPTVVTFSQDVSFNGIAVAAGEYQIYTYPGTQVFDVVLNDEIPGWGASEPDPSTDILHTDVAVKQGNASMEQFTIELQPSSDGVTFVVKWDKLILEIPIKKN